MAGVDYEAVVGTFGELDSDLTAPLRVVADPASGFPHGLNLACDDSPALADLTGQIALLGWGTCDVTVKVRNAQNAGAVGVIMVNREPGPAFTMSHNELEPKPTIPTVMVSLADGAVIDDHDGEPAPIRALAAYVTRPADTHLMAGFSSQGPTQQDLLVKPDVVAPGADVVAPGADVVAPGADVLSVFPATHCKTPPSWAIIGGTSMVTPHLAGAAAVVRGIHPDWDAATVRSTIVNTAQEGLLRDTETGAVTNDALVVGCGLLEVDAAAVAAAAPDPVSTSFGGLASGGGRTLTRTVAVTNLPASTATLAASVADDAADSVTFSTSGGTLMLAPGATGQLAVSVVWPRAQPTVPARPPSGSRRAASRSPIRCCSSSSVWATAPRLPTSETATGIDPPLLTRASTGERHLLAFAGVGVPRSRPAADAASGARIEPGGPVRPRHGLCMCRALGGVTPTSLSSDDARPDRVNFFAIQ